MKQRMIIFLANDKAYNEIDRLNNYMDHLGGLNGRPIKIYTTLQGTKEALKDSTIGVLYTTQPFVLDYALLDRFDIIISDGTDKYSAFWEKEDGSLGYHCPRTDWSYIYKTYSMNVSPYMFLDEILGE